MIGTLFSVFVLLLLLVTAVAIVQTANLFVASMLAGIFSLLLATTFFLLDAADVALTEAAVGAGISTVLFLSALALTSETERTPARWSGLALAVVATAAAVLIYATFDKPAFGDPEAPVHTHVAPWYISQTAAEVDIPNIVTAVLASFRAYDTLGEVFVVLTAGIGVLFLLSARRGIAYRDDIARRDGEGLRHYVIPRVVGRLLIPFILIFGLYVQFHGEYGPGGAFQAGAIIAAGFILLALLEGEERALQAVPLQALLYLSAGGALLYGGVGVASVLLGGNFLEYRVFLPGPAASQQLGIIAIELGVGLTVTGVLLSIFHAFAARGRGL